MGLGAAFDLVHNSPDVTSVTIADSDRSRADDVASRVGTSKIEPQRIDASNYDDVVSLMQGHDSAISCVNYWYNESLSRAAIQT